jgi:broad specificity phosphatase PhoE
MRILRIFTAAILVFTGLAGVSAAQATPSHLYLYLVRHGQSTDNAKGLQSGWSPAALTSLGQSQAAAIASRLATVNFTSTYSSGSVRAAQTLNAILAARTDGLPALIDARFREWGVGSFEQKPVSVVQAAQAKKLKTTVAGLSRFSDQQKFDALAAVDPAKTAETWSKFKSRILAGASDLTRSTPNGSVLVVTHGYVIKHLIYLLTGKYTSLSISNTSVTELDYSSGKWRLVQGPTLKPKVPAALPTQ